MQCSHARILMDERLDGGTAPGLAEHTATCPQCARDWTRLQAAERSLRGQRMVEAPAHVTSRIMNHIDAESRSLASWQQTLLRVALLLVGVLLVLASTAAFVHGWWQVLTRPSVAAQVDGLARGAGLVSGMLVDAIGVSAVVWPVYAGLTVALALVWFGALVVPRFAPRASR